MVFLDWPSVLQLQGHQNHKDRSQRSKVKLPRIGYQVGESAPTHMSHWYLLAVPWRENPFENGKITKSPMKTNCSAAAWRLSLILGDGCMFSNLWSCSLDHMFSFWLKKKKAVLSLLGRGSTFLLGNNEDNHNKRQQKHQQDSTRLLCCTSQSHLTATMSN